MLGSIYAMVGVAMTLSIGILRFLNFSIPALFMIGGMVYYWPSTAQLQRTVAEQYPAEVLPFLKTHPPAGLMLNFYLWGGYLELNDRNVKTFVDSRVDIFEYANVLQDYLNLLTLKQPKPILDKYKIRYVLFPHSEPLTYVLEHDPEWKEIYSDEVCVLLERVGASPGTATQAHP